MDEFFSFHFENRSVESKSTCKYECGLWVWDTNGTCVLVYVATSMMTEMAALPNTTIYTRSKKQTDLKEQ